MILQFLINGFITGLLYALLALAFSLVYNTTKIFHIAFAGIVVLSSFVFYTFYSLLGLHWVLALLISVFCIGIINSLIEIFIYQKLESKKANTNNILVASIGVFIIITNLVAMIYGNENKSYSNEIEQSFTFGNIIITQMQMIQLLVCIILVIAFLVIVNKTNIGIKIKALSNSSILYEVLGQSSKKFRIFLFFVSGILACIVSLLISFDVGFDPYFGMSLLLNALVAMIIGGFGSFKGSVFGGIILGMIQSISIYFFESRWESAISFLILIIILVFRPQGLFGERQRLI